VNTIFSLFYSFSGANYFLFHSFQIIFHIINACLLFLFLKHFFRKQIALILSLIFLVHPINSEVALYVSDTQEVLFFLFGVLALWKLKHLKSKKYLIFIAISLLLSLFSKETGLLFICIVIFY